MKTLTILLLLAIISALSADAKDLAVLKPNQIDILYVAPTNPAHQPIYNKIKERRVLERFRDYLNPLRLPGKLLLKTEGCDGVSNAWYDESEHSVAVCYEYLEEIQINAPKVTTAAGVTPTDALIGPTLEVFLHEISHALFDMAKIPILGHEEDAADQMAAYLLLQLEKEDSRRTVAGVAFMYMRESKEQSTQMEEFSGVHGLPAQRFYNLLCLAYGANPDVFGDIVAKGYLPKNRADGCADEYQQVSYAYKTLILPYIDQTQNKVKKKKMMRPDPTK
jgi:hypothetical protein